MQTKLASLIVAFSTMVAFPDAEAESSCREFIITHGTAAYSKDPDFQEGFQFFGRSSDGHSIRLEFVDGTHEDGITPLREEYYREGNHAGIVGRLPGNASVYVDDELAFSHGATSVTFSGNSTATIPWGFPIDTELTLNGPATFSASGRGPDGLTFRGVGTGNMTVQVARLPQGQNFIVPQMVEFQFDDPMTNFLGLHLRDEGKTWLSNHGTEPQFPRDIEISSSMGMLVPQVDPTPTPFQRVSNNDAESFKLEVDQTVELLPGSQVPLPTTYRNSVTPDLIGIASPGEQPLRVIDERPWSTQARLEVREENRFWIVNPMDEAISASLLELVSNSESLVPPDDAAPFQFANRTPTSREILLLTASRVSVGSQQQIPTKTHLTPGASVGSVMAEIGIYRDGAVDRLPLSIADARPEVMPLSIQDRGERGVWIYNAGDNVRELLGLELVSANGSLTPSDELAGGDGIVATEATPFEQALGNRPSVAAFRSLEPIQLSPGLGVLVAAGINTRAIAGTLPMDDLTLAVQDHEGLWALPRLQTSVYGDFNLDQQVNATDIDLLASQLGAGLTVTDDHRFDLNSDNFVNAVDHEMLVTSVLSTSYGDADLNGTVGFADFLQMSRNFGNAGGWSAGDFDGDGDVRFSDFLHLSANFLAMPSATVSEPTMQCWLVLAALIWVRGTGNLSPLQARRVTG